MGVKQSPNGRRKRMHINQQYQASDLHHPHLLWGNRDDGYGPAAQKGEADERLAGASGPRNLLEADVHVRGSTRCTNLIKPRALCPTCVDFQSNPRCSAGLYCRECPNKLGAARSNRDSSPRSLTPKNCRIKPSGSGRSTTRCNPSCHAVKVMGISTSSPSFNLSKLL